MNLLDTALEVSQNYHWSVIPVRDKASSVKWEPYQERVPTEREIKEMFSQKGITGLAVITGKVSGGLAVRDLDFPKAYDLWREKFPQEAEKFPTVQTGRGYHIWFRVPPDFLSYLKLDDGEYRGDSKHYTLIPPSLHPSGKTYEWKIPPSREIPFLQNPLLVGLLDIHFSPMGL